MRCTFRRKVNIGTFICKTDFHFAYIRSEEITQLDATIDSLTEDRDEILATLDALDKDR